MNADISDLKHMIWRQMPTGQTTWSLCFNGCGKPARGGGQCIECLEDKLGALVGAKLASDYIAAVRRIRNVEHEIENVAKC